jgi:hypothetical protein
MTLFATRDGRLGATVTLGAEPCDHTCELHPPARHEGAKLTLRELDARAMALPYSPGAGAGFDRTAARGWVLGTQPEVPSYLMGGAVERRQAVERYDPSPLAVATRARRGWLDIAGRIPEGVGPATLRTVNPEVAQLADLIASLDVLDQAGLEELWAQ